MRTANLLRVQLQLQSHRRWLTTFVSEAGVNRRPGHTVSPPSGIQHSSRPYLRRINHDARSYSTKAKAKTRLVIKKPSVRPRLLQDDAIAWKLRQTVQDANIQQVAELYSTLHDKSILRPNDVRIIAQCLHRALRDASFLSDALTRREATDVLQAFADLVVKDITAGRLAPQPQACVHLLSFFKESGTRDAGVRFWMWLEQQDDGFLNADVYGAAIELLAVNGSPLAELEGLYRQALRRFPGPFLSYHLSPDAFVPDRKRATTLKGIPVILLRGIFSARLLHGDTQSAYLAFDTALRLYPDQVPSRFHKMILEERPLLEAYTVFAMACRSGTRLPSSLLSRLLVALRTSFGMSTPDRHAIAVRASLSALYLYTLVGRRVTTNNLNEFIILLTQFLRLPGIASLDIEGTHKIVNELMDVIRRSLIVFARHGVKPGLSAFNSIINNLGGFGQSKEIVNVALADAQSLGLQPNAVTRRSMMTAAGHLKDNALLVDTWNDIIKARAAANQVPDATDFHVLIKACVQANQLGFARQQMDAFKDAMPPSDHDRICAALESTGQDNRGEKSSPEIDGSTVAEKIEEIRADLAMFDQATQDGSQIQDLRDRLLPMNLSRSQSGIPEPDMCKIYDEMTTEQRPGSVSTEPSEGDQDPLPPTPSLEPAESDVDQATSPTNIPFDTLRYENWKTMNYLLEQAEIYDRTFLERVDAAIAAGEMPPKRAQILFKGIDDGLESYGISDTFADRGDSDRCEPEVDAAKVNEEREKIWRLRGRHA